jgi:hypothetical protein
MVDLAPATFAVASGGSEVVVLSFSHRIALR